ncbi:MAG: metallophosphoesterase family protein [Hyphomicrobiaceae bacterium]
MSQTFTLAHLSDIHLAPIVGFGMAHWRVKRLLGYVNWHRKRKGVHLRAVVDRLVADLLAQGPDHIAVTGDLVNLGLPGEQAAALEWLRSIGSADRVTVVPGNHDIYVRMWRDPGTARWQDYMRPNAEGSGYGASGHPFPFVRRFGQIALIGVNSAIPTLPVLARGRVGREQLQRLGRVLDILGRERLIRIVLIHYPPLPGQSSPSRKLLDAEAMQQVLSEHGAELVLHGHNHTNTLAFCSSRGATIPVVGITSASLGRRYHDEPLGRYNLCRITAVGGVAKVLLTARGLAEPDGPVVELERREIEAPMARQG